MISTATDAFSDRSIEFYKMVKGNGDMDQPFFPVS